MGRFAYQPLNEEQVKISQSGQLIMGRQDAHISVNKNGIIISKTKEIEEKIADINELKHDVDEQHDVILNLIEDFASFIEGDLAEAYAIQEEVYVLAKKLMTKVNYLDDVERSMQEKLDRIQETINDYERANNIQLSRLDGLESESTNSLAKIGTMAYVQEEYNKIMALRITYA
jgi:tetrahydromethanopterin S-methyltransferase subunit B